jgi:hypothetical protein
MTAGASRVTRPSVLRSVGSPHDAPTRGGPSEASRARQAAALGEALLAALSKVVEPSANSQWVALDAEAKKRGLSTTALRRWCMRRGVVIRQESHRRAWVSPRSIDEVIENLPTADVAPSRRTRSADDELDRVIDDQATRARRGRSSAPSR